MKQQLFGSVLAILVFACPALAAEKLSNTQKIQLQAAMQMSISRQLVNGEYLYFDAKNDKVVNIYPVQAHPVILHMGEHYILCSDFRNEKGDKINVDFYITRRKNKFIVFDTVIDDDKSIKRMLKSGLAHAVR